MLSFVSLDEFQIEALEKSTARARVIIQNREPRRFSDSDADTLQLQNFLLAARLGFIGETCHQNPAA
jgi:hypothetical protein